MTSTRANPIAKAWGIPSTNLPAPHRAPAAGVEPLPASAAFSHFTESWGQDDAAPAENPTPIPAAGTVVIGVDLASKPDMTVHYVVLSAHAMILLRAISAYEQVDDATAITMALATHATRIGAGPLARATLDEIERLSSNTLRERVAGGAGGVDACPACGLADDLHAVPEHIRRGQNRFRSGGP